LPQRPGVMTRLLRSWAQDERREGEVRFMTMQDGCRVERHGKA